MRHLPQRHDGDRARTTATCRRRQHARRATSRRRHSRAPRSATPVSRRAAPSCHNGTTATGKNNGHVQTTAACETCHKSTTSFAGAAFSHTGITAGCASCHNGTTAPGKNNGHVQTTAACETCHKSTTSFDGAAFVHPANAAGRCQTCHGVDAPGKPTVHIATTTTCDDCHKKGTTSFALPTMNHAVVSPLCSTCHKDQFPGVTSLPLTGHPTVQTGQECSACHKSTTSFAGAAFVHPANAPGRCQIAMDRRLRPNLQSTSRPRRRVTTATRRARRRSPCRP